MISFWLIVISNFEGMVETLSEIFDDINEGK
jgi:hypothetical protein